MMTKLLNDHFQADKRKYALFDQSTSNKIKMTEIKVPMILSISFAILSFMKRFEESITPYQLEQAIDIF